MSSRFVCHNCSNEEYIDFKSYPAVTKYKWIKEYIEEESLLVTFCGDSCKESYFKDVDWGDYDDDSNDFWDEDDWGDFDDFF